MKPGAACAHCGGRQDPLSRQATQNGMGPWFVRDERAPFRPGCSFETLAKMVSAGAVTADSVVRGPSTHQFWVRATKAAGVARLLGVCHACGQGVRADEYLCRACGAALEVEMDRQHLGLGQTRAVPGRDARPVPAGSAAGAAESAAAIASRVRVSAGEAEPIHARYESVHVSRVASLERAVRRERRMRAGLVSLCVVLVALLGVVLASGTRGERDLGGDPQAGDAGEASPRTAVEAATPGEVTAPDGPVFADAALPVTEDAAWLEIEREILDPDTTHDEPWLDAQIERLQAMAERGELPERGERLLEALRAERERLDLRVLP